VELTHYNLVSNLVQVHACETELLVPSAVLHAVLPLYHVYALVVVLLIGLRHGMTIVIQSKFDLVQVRWQCGNAIELVSTLTPAMHSCAALFVL